MRTLTFEASTTLLHDFLQNRAQNYKEEMSNHILEIKCFLYKKLKKINTIL